LAPLAKDIRHEGPRTQRYDIFVVKFTMKELYKSDCSYCFTGSGNISRDELLSNDKKYDDEENR
jgi:hypothetical protein